MKKNILNTQKRKQKHKNTQQMLAIKGHIDKVWEEKEKNQIDGVIKLKEREKEKKLRYKEGGG